MRHDCEAKAANAATVAVEPHPMVSVPEALRIVLQVAARQRRPTLLSTAKDDNNNNDDDRDGESILLPLSQALGRRLTKPVVMPNPGYPPYPASIMDGYCIKSNDAFQAVYQDCKEMNQPTHVIVDKVYAGDDTKVYDQNDSHSNESLPTAIYVTTGAKIPKGYDCVVPIEECQLLENGTRLCIYSSATIAANQWIRPAGCDLPPGLEVLSPGHVLDAVALALCRQAACTSVHVAPKTKVGILSTGNELLAGVDNESDEHWSIEKHGVQGIIPDVNKPMLMAAIGSWEGIDVVDLGMCRDDDADIVTKCLYEASRSCQVIITTGGISMGETDILEKVLVRELCGTLHFGRLHMKPGKPTSLVTLNDNRCMVFALPGNPVSAYVCAHLLVQPCLHLLYARSGQKAMSSRDRNSSNGEQPDTIHDSIVSNAWVHPEVEAELAQDILLDPERPEYHRVTLTWREQGGWLASSTGTQRSSRLASLKDANGLMVLPQGSGAGDSAGSVEPQLPHQTHAKAGERYTVLLLKPFFPSLIPATRVSSSRHLNPLQPLSSSSHHHHHPALQVALIEFSSSSTVASNGEALAQMAHSALAGSRSGSVQIQSAKTVISTESFGGSGSDSSNTLDALWDQVLHQTVNSFENPPDIILLVSLVDTHSNSFCVHHQLAHALRTRLLQKVADAVAQQVRAGAASADATAALWEVVVGFTRIDNANKEETTTTTTTNGMSLLVFLSELGFEAALGNVRGLLKHALAMARNQNHHHGDKHE